MCAKIDNENKIRLMSQINGRFSKPLIDKSVRIMKIVSESLSKTNYAKIHTFPIVQSFKINAGKIVGQRGRL